MCVACAGRPRPVRRNRVESVPAHVECSGRIIQSHSLDQFGGREVVIRESARGERCIQEDTNSDGRYDLVSWVDAANKLNRVEVDVDYDGRVDITAVYGETQAAQVVYYSDQYERQPEAPRESIETDASPHHNALQLADAAVDLDAYSIGALTRALTLIHATSDVGVLVADADGLSRQTLSDRGQGDGGRTTSGGSSGNVGQNGSDSRVREPTPGQPNPAVRPQSLRRTTRPPSVRRPPSNRPRSSDRARDPANRSSQQ
jgi:hypothetical protein